MKIFRNMALALLAAAYAAGCEKTPELIAGGAPVAGEEIDMSFGLVTAEMADPDPEAAAVASRTAGGSQAVALSRPESTRATDPGTPEEQAINGVWLLEFNGTGDDALLVLKTYYPADEISDGSLTAKILQFGTDVSIYIVANVADDYFNSLDLQTTLAAFEAQCCDIAIASSVPAAGLPMAGLYTGPTATAPVTVELERLVAKITFTCNVDWKEYGSFELGSVRIVSGAAGTAYAEQAVPDAATGLYPDASQAANFTDGEAVAITAGVPVTWYVAENLRGVVAGLTESTKGGTNAPDAATCIEVTGNYVEGDRTNVVYYRIYPGRNATDDFNVIRNHAYTISATIQGMDESDLRVETIEVRDLSAAGTANCYMIDRAGVNYSFKASVKGNGATTPAALGPEIDGTEPLQPASVRVLWETGGQNNVIQSIELVDGADGKKEVSFVAAGTKGQYVAEGSALIGVFDDAGTLLWSWHIWATRYNPDVEFDALPMGYYFMRHNLGADVSAMPGDAARCGFYYQWGRKDPLVGPENTDSATPAWATTSTWNDEQYQWGSRYTNQSGEAQLLNAIQMPTTFLRGYEDWLATDLQDRRLNLWAGTVTSDDPAIVPKSIYDPCPPGWCVPPRAVWWQSGNTPVTPATKGFTYLGSYYPAGGFIEDGNFQSVGTYGSYWTSVANVGIAFTGTSAFLSNSAFKTYAMTIRCVKETTQLGEIEDLSANGTANSYIVNEAGTEYRFKATVMGNGAETPEFESQIGAFSTAPAITPSTLTPDDVIVVWETGSAQGSVIAAGSVRLENGYVIFTTAGTEGQAVTEGNAVIAVRDASDQILWSWHIWSTSYDPETDFDTYTNFASKQYQVMKYNLGADATADPSSAAIYGLLYQWGRKDPFVGAATTSSSGTDYAATANASGYGWTNEAASKSGDEQIAYSIQNPTKFFCQRGDWVAESYYRRDNLWGNPTDRVIAPTPTNEFDAGSKSIYDPCPPGWQVAPQDTWTGFTSTGKNTSTSGGFNVDGSFSNGWNFYTSGTGSGDTTFYPAAGYRSYSSGELYGVGSEGYSCSSSPYSGGSNNAGRLSFRSDFVDPLISDSRANGSSVRCVKE